MDNQKKKRTIISSWKLILFISAIAIIVLLVLKQNGTITQSTHCRFNRNHRTLIFTQILFRHGERTPMDIAGPYLNDPYRDFKYEPYGPGALTDVGKQTLYEVGKYIKTYYCNLLKHYHRDIVYARSSPISRCQISLLTLLAGLFPPGKSKALANDLNWQAIPYDYDKWGVDITFMYFIHCKKYVQLYQIETEKSIKNKEKNNFKELTEKLVNLTGNKFTSYRDVFTLYLHLKGQKEFGLELPDWTEHYMPLLKDYELISYDISTRSDELKRLSGGFILRELIESIKLKIDNPDRMKHRKIHLYSGHEYTIANLMGTLGLKCNNSIPYGSFISLELHQINREFFVKILSYQPSNEQPEVLMLDGYKEFCPLENFLNTYSKYQAKPDMCKLDGGLNLTNSTEKYYNFIKH